MSNNDALREWAEICGISTTKVDGSCVPTIEQLAQFAALAASKPEPQAQDESAGSKAQQQADAEPQAQAGEPDNWRQYAKDGENAQQCIERHRGEQDALLELLKKSRLPYSDNEEMKL